MIQLKIYQQLVLSFLFSCIVFVGSNNFRNLVINKRLINETFN